MQQPTLKPIPTGGDLPNRSMGVRRRQAVPIFVHQDVLEEILDYSERDLSRELGGFLLGGFHRDRFDYVEVRHFLAAVDTPGRISSVTFTHDTWSAMTRQVARRFPEESVVGWQHTHPGLGVFLSGYDLFIHRNFFDQPWQIAMVVDPRQEEFGFFQWREDKVVDCGFVCVGAGE